MVKSAKLQFVDSGLAARLLGVHDHPVAHPLASNLVECFVVQELVKQGTWHERRIRAYHFRTHTGREVDIVRERDDGRLVGIEVELAASVGPVDTKGLAFLRDAVGERFVRGIVL